MLPAAHSILWFMAAFLLLWAASLLWRGVARGSGNRRCPACRKPVAMPAKACGACGFASDRERDFPRAHLHWRFIGAAGGALVAAAVAACLGAWVHSWSQEEWWEGEGSGLGPWESAALGVAAFGLILAIWSWRGDRSRGRKRCPKCWYDMSGGSLKCPECGHEASAGKHLYRPRRRRVAAVAGLLILASSYGVWVVPDVAAGGWLALCPTWVLIVGMEWLPEQCIRDESAFRQYDEDRTLYGRYLDTNWSWQDRWIERRARAIAASTVPLRVVDRVLPFLHESDAPRVFERVIARAIEQLCAPTAAGRSEAAKLLGSGSWMYYEPDGVEPSPEQLRRLVPGFMRGLNDADRDVAAMCAFYVGQCGPEGAPAVPRLIEMLGGSRGEQLHATMALMRLKCDSQAAADLIFGATWRPDAVIAQETAFVLGAVPEDPRARARLRDLLEHASDDVAAQAAGALGRLRDKAAIPAVLRQVDAGRSNPGHFIRVLGWFDDERLDYLPEIIGALRHPSADARREAAELLAEMPRRASMTGAAVPALDALRVDPDPDVAKAAAAAVERITRDEPDR